MYWIFSSEAQKESCNFVKLDYINQLLQAFVIGQSIGRRSPSDFWPLPFPNIN